MENYYVQIERIRISGRQSTKRTKLGVDRINR